EFLATYYDSPVYVRLVRINTPVIFGDDYKFEFGRGYVIKEGRDVTMVSTGAMLFKILEVHDKLKERGISAEVIHMPTIKPLDKETLIKSVSKTGKVITVEEHSIIGGLGSAVAEAISENYPCCLVRTGIQDLFAESGEPEDLFKKYGLSVDTITEKVIQLLKKK
ncbi:MAG TPA: transketolase C-terminal domain-containing protein, partial [Candidatus Goldiibacteriota bacterium]|nr:transketolase C-terminal domain-containing protein [Candidatus Goldiibacteriota bacterium]